MYFIKNTKSQYLAFIALGLRNTVSGRNAYDSLLRKWDRGEAELINQCATAAACIKMVVDAIGSDIKSAPRGLVEYAVAEQFGQFVYGVVRLAGEFPTRHAQIERLSNLFLLYFRNGDISDDLPAMVKNAVNTWFDPVAVRESTPSMSKSWLVCGRVDGQHLSGKNPMPQNLPKFLTTIPVADGGAFIETWARARESAPLYSMYIFAGWRDAINDLESSVYRATTENLGGEIGVARFIADAAEKIAFMLLTDFKDAEFPGVWEYEIAEHIGRWLAVTNADMPVSEMIDFARTTTAAWIKGDAV